MTSEQRKLPGTERDPYIMIKVSIHQEYIANHKCLSTKQQSCQMYRTLKTDRTERKKDKSTIITEYFYMPLSATGKHYLAENEQKCIRI